MAQVEIKTEGCQKHTGGNLSPNLLHLFLLTSNHTFTFPSRSRLSSSSHPAARTQACYRDFMVHSTVILANLTWTRLPRPTNPGMF